MATRYMLCWSKEFLDGLLKGVEVDCSCSTPDEAVARETFARLTDRYLKQTVCKDTLTESKYRITRVTVREF